MIPRVVFCPKCRRPIKIPIRGADNVQILTNITIQCGHETKFKGKSVKCDGKVVIKAKK
jgi:Zn ribbon nucleic-acid-binding protein